MDKNFEPLEQLYLSQAFDKCECEEQMLEECKMIAKAYALTENAVSQWEITAKTAAIVISVVWLMFWAYRWRNASVCFLRSTSTLSLTVAILMTSANVMLTR